MRPESGETGRTRLLALWAGLPRRWKSLIRKLLAKAKDMMPLEQGVIKRMMDLLR